MRPPKGGEVCHHQCQKIVSVLVNFWNKTITVRVEAVDLIFYFILYFGI